MTRLATAPLALALLFACGGDDRRAAPIAPADRVPVSTEDTTLPVRAPDTIGTRRPIPSPRPAPSVPQTSPD